MSNAIDAEVRIRPQEADIEDDDDEDENDQDFDDVDDDEDPTTDSDSDDEGSMNEHGKNENISTRLEGMQSQQVAKKWREQMLETDMTKASSRTEALWTQYEEDEAKYPGERSIVFSGMTSSLDLVAIMFEQNDVVVYRYDGRMNDVERRQALREFQEGPPHRSVLLMTGGSGGVNLNLQSASRIYQLVIWWNRASELQAYDRAYRIKVRVFFARNAHIDAHLRRKNAEEAHTNNSIMQQLTIKDGVMPNIPTLP